MGINTLYTMSRIAVGPRVQCDTLAAAYLKKKKQQRTNEKKSITALFGA
jgi:hypothetical protein